MLKMSRYKITCALKGKEKRKLHKLFHNGSLPCKKLPALFIPLFFYKGIYGINYFFHIFKRLFLHIF